MVDDDDQVRAVVKHALERAGYAVILADSGPAAIEIVRQQGDRIDLVVLDLCMPVMGGADALPRLRIHKPDLKVLVSSGFCEQDALQVFRNAHISGFIRKPYTPGELAAAVKAAMA